MMQNKLSGVGAGLCENMANSPQFQVEFDETENSVAKGISSVLKNTVVKYVRLS